VDTLILGVHLQSHCALHRISDTTNTTVTTTTTTTTTILRPFIQDGRMVEVGTG